MEPEAATMTNVQRNIKSIMHPIENSKRERTSVEAAIERSTERANQINQESIPERRRSSRPYRSPKSYIEMMRIEIVDRTDGHKVPMEILCAEILAPIDVMETSFGSDIIAHPAKFDPDTMYWYETIKQPDADKLKEAAA